MGPDNKKNSVGSQHQTLDKGDASEAVDIEGSIFKPENADQKLVDQPHLWA